jgi:RsiW-degrading membrane proteinase PrsW (M82 family)
MSNNRAFFKNAQKGHMTLSDIFSDVGKKHSSRDTAKVFISGTELTTPSEAEMLAGWQKPFLFARFFGGGLLFVLLCFLLGHFLDHPGGYYLMMVSIPFLMPVTLLLLVWEMNIPRNISLVEIMKIVLVGGIISLIAAVVGFQFDGVNISAWAGLVEEPAKLLVIYMVLRKKNYKYSINGLLIGVAVGTGFAVMESIYYVLNNNFEGILGIAPQAIDALRNGQASASEAVSAMMMSGFSNGIRVAILRALTALSGHGIYAGLYGYALVKVKGSKEIMPGHMLQPEFLLYFAAAILLHALHNSGISLGLPLLFNFLPLEYVIIAAIAVVQLLSVLRPAVNQTVEYAKRHNAGRVTVAVERGESTPIAAASAAGFQLQCVAGPSVGQVYRLQGDRPLTIGRASGRNDIALPNCKNVSGMHCRIQISGNTVTVTDLGSTNGTYMDTQRLMPQQPMPVNPGATISLGDKSVAFKLQRI